ncbi:uncharacterized protein N7506_001194 [Penicillium brevicompactum]|uniref:uncharacterized protein n=1 Tax=Penicillium brevicompactum TaxID=5074 RepID=UPI00253FF43B|nr:uncharacterized protein N7506_001194 [Penicillium brevicompactum]KAJ5347941.1 hypothetical protein N7506_001194 [Penicillium brevicompactum]
MLLVRVNSQEPANSYRFIFTLAAPSTPGAMRTRSSKPYHHPILDRLLTRSPVAQEARCLAKIRREGVEAPDLLTMRWEGRGGEHSE